MSRAKQRRTRKNRRNVNKVLKFGVGAKPKHRLKTGRTGQVHVKRLKSRR